MRARIVVSGTQLFQDQFSRPTLQYEWCLPVVAGRLGSRQLYHRSHLSIYPKGAEKDLDCRVHFRGFYHYINSNITKVKRLALKIAC